MNRLAVEVVVVGLLIAAFAAWIHTREVQAEKRGIEKQVQVQKEAAAKQKEIDDQKLKEAGEQYAKDMADIAKYNFDGGTASVVCRATPRRVPETGIPSSPNTVPGVVATDDVVHTDVTYALRVYAAGVAALAADHNRLVSEVK